MFTENIRFSVHNGVTISFWSDRWSKAGTMEVLFPRLFNLSRQKTASFAAVAASSWAWRRRLRLTEKSELDGIIGHMNQITLNSCPDKINWSKARGIYTANSFCNLFRQGSAEGNSTFSLAWSSVSPPKIMFFISLALHRRVSSLSLLHSRNIVAADAIHCSLCNQVETQEHILIHCDFATSVWNRIISKVGLSLVLLYYLQDFLQQWRTLIPSRGKLKLWHSPWDVTIWELWKCRNKRLYNDSTTEIEEVVFRCFTSACLYVKCNDSSISYSGLDFYRNPDCILFH
ncbi:uncharacterized protein LOC126681627 [Mercurialis annua]|uniref:uncharacterized protein LOC126681627 n=1 Tax=Mercurialis annua TaxID=3986 RepID=UPI00215E68E5|nr:uncharacterized protein LOC126681627 [Mercurialis annua]